MAWWVQPLQIADAHGKGIGRWRLTATSDEDGGGPFGDESHDHESASAASACQKCRDYCSGIAGFPPLAAADQQKGEPKCD